ncbi:class I adenylate-forming enzyme family protein [Humibacter sp.]|uniref:class I adenylate-forming enzyme family protein n=1 Tax=Humibacter sp. TaxID=1940291 RepID=UPI002B93F224|nr:AMP-binding protein [Humibacter sp.]HVX09162.1 AMP-binding protein [Humibacter sp.]
MTAGPLYALLSEHPSAADEALVTTIDGSVSLAEVRRSVDTLASTLAETGVHAGHHVAVVIDDGIGALVGAFATWKIGAVVVPLNARLTTAELRDALTSAAPAAVVADDPSRAPAGHRVLERAGLTTWRAVPGTLAHAPAEQGEDAALVMRTSGTTGAPKAVVMRHSGVLGGIDTVAGQLRARPSDTGPKAPMPNLIPTSLGLWAGLWNALFGLRVGAPLVLMDRFETTTFATLVQRHGIRSTILAPAMMSMLTADPDITDLAPLRLVRSVTAPLTPAQARAFRERFGVGVLNCYGQTELGSEVVGWTAKDLRDYGDDKLGAVGRAHPGVDIKILDEQGNVAADGVGEVWIRSPFLSQQDDAIAARLDEAGFLQTGDIGRVDADGFLWLEGRVSDVINRGGLKVMPQEVEDAIRVQPGVADVCVAGVPDDRLGEVPVAWLVAVSGAEIRPDEIASALRARLAPYKLPVDLRVVDELPRNEIGKVLRRSLIEGYP